MAEKDVWDQLEEYEKQETGGGGVIGQFAIDLGYKVYAAGTSNDESFFMFTPGDEKSDAKAKAEAIAFQVEHGAEKEPRKCVRFVIYKNKVMGGKGDKWKDNRHFVYPLWTDGYKQVIKKAIKDLHITKMGEYWGKFAWTNDPSGRTEKGQNGEERVALIAFPVELYPNEAAAEAAASGQSATNGFNAEEWRELQADIAAAVKEATKKLKSPAKAKEAVAAEYQLNGEQLDAVLALK